MNELEVMADRLLAQVTQDPEYPFRTEGQMWRRRGGRGRAFGRFREVHIPLSAAEPGANPEERTVAAMERQYFLQCAELTTEERCCLLLAVQYEFSDDEIGDLIGKHRNTVRDRRALAFLKLRRLADDGCAQNEFLMD